jgi:predicted transcriptional regulator
MYKYDKLRGRIIEKYGTQARYAEILGISQTAMSSKMNCKTRFDQTDIRKWCELLDINTDDVGEYFFA